MLKRYNFLTEQLEDYREKNRKLKKMLENKEALARELQELEKEIEDSRFALREAEEDMKRREIQQRNDEEWQRAMDTKLGRVSGELERHMERLEAQSESLERIKAELADKIHTENVKCYRNIQALLEECTKDLKEDGKTEAGIKKTKGCAVGALVIGIVNLVVLLVWIAYQMDLFFYLF